MKNWKQLSSSVVHKNPWYQVRKDEVVRPDGSPGEYYVVETGGASVYIIVVDDQEKILLIGQERYTSGTFSWEIPGGNSDGQEPAKAAARELLEETGIEANKWEFIGDSYVMGGISSEKGYMYKVTGLIFHQENKQYEEGITHTKWVTLQDIKRMIKNGEITDNQTITAIAIAFLVE
jgi:8-oxo-dGTP pyrophosphatase MutT (NUDIX family)